MVFYRCIVKITGDMTLSFPMGIIKVFTTNPSPAVLTFKLKNTSRLEQILPNQQLLYRWGIEKKLKYNPVLFCFIINHLSWAVESITWQWWSERGPWTQWYERESRKCSLRQWEEIQLVIWHEPSIKLSGKYFPPDSQVLSSLCLFKKMP